MLFVEQKRLGGVSASVHHQVGTQCRRFKLGGWTMAGDTLEAGRNGRGSGDGSRILRGVVRGQLAPRRAGMVARCPRTTHSIGVGAPASSFEAPCGALQDEARGGGAQILQRPL